MKLCEKYNEYQINVVIGGQFGAHDVCIMCYVLRV